MTNIIFARPRHDYGSYQDLWQLISLSGFPLVYYDEIDVDADATYILTIRNGDIENGFPTSRARLVLWDIEYRHAPPPPIPGVPEVWHMDKWQAELIGAKYVPIGGHAGLRPRETTNPEHYDVAFLAYMTHRRQHIRNDLLARGVALTPTSAWGMERDLYLSASRAYLHVHQSEEFPAVPGLRLVVAAAYKLPVIMERCSDIGIFDAHCILSSSFDEISQNAHEWTRGEASTWNILHHWGDALHQKLCIDNPFRDVVERAL